MNTLTGILELPSGGGDGRIRKFNNGLEETPDDPYLPSELVQKFALRPGQEVTAVVEDRHAPNRPSGVKRVAIDIQAIEDSPRPTTPAARSSRNSRHSILHRACTWSTAAARPPAA